MACSLDSKNLSAMSAILSMVLLEMLSPVLMCRISRRLRTFRRAKSKNDGGCCLTKDKMSDAVHGSTTRRAYGSGNGPRLILPNQLYVGGHIDVFMSRSFHNAPYPTGLSCMDLWQ